MRLASYPLAVWVASCAFAQVPTLEDSLARIREQVDIFEKRLPDFVCHEKITSRTESATGEIEKQTTIESVFAGRQKRAHLVGTSFTEERQIETVNGAPWKEKEMPKGIFRIGGGYSSALVMVFGKNSEANYSFTPVDDQDKSSGKLVIAFTTRTGKNRVKSAHGAQSFQGSGRAWFDAGTFQIDRLEETILTKNDDPEKPLKITVEFAPASIGEEKFQMPRHVTAVAYRGAKRGVYEAEYTDYRKYGSSSTIQYGTPK